MTSKHEYNPECKICRTDSGKECFITANKEAYCFKCLNYNPNRIIKEDMKVIDVAKNFLINDLPFAVRNKMFHDIQAVKENIDWCVARIWRRYTECLVHMDHESSIQYISYRMVKYRKQYAMIYHMFHCNTLESLAENVVYNIKLQKGF